MGFRCSGKIGKAIAEGRFWRKKRDWKLIEYLDGTGDVELYQISKDIGETKNLLPRGRGELAT